MLLFSNSVSILCNCSLSVFILHNPEKTNHFFTISSSCKQSFPYLAQLLNFKPKATVVFGSLAPKQKQVISLSQSSLCFPIKSHRLKATLPLNSFVFFSVPKWSSSYPTLETDPPPSFFSLFWGKKDLSVGCSIYCDFTIFLLTVQFLGSNLPGSCHFFLFSSKLTEKGSGAENLLFAELSWRLKQSLLFPPPFPFLYRKRRVKKMTCLADKNLNNIL